MYVDIKYEKDNPNHNDQKNDHNIDHNQNNHDNTDYNHNNHNNNNKNNHNNDHNNDHNNYHNETIASLTSITNISSVSLGGFEESGDGFGLIHGEEEACKKYYSFFEVCYNINFIVYVLTRSFRTQEIVLQSTTKV